MIYPVTSQATQVSATNGPAALLQNIGAEPIYLGGDTSTSPINFGLRIAPGGTANWPAENALYACTEAGKTSELSALFGAYGVSLSQVDASIAGTVDVTGQVGITGQVSTLNTQDVIAYRLAQPANGSITLDVTKYASIEIILNIPAGGPGSLSTMSITHWTNGVPWENAKELITIPQHSPSGGYDTEVRYVIPVQGEQITIAWNIPSVVGPVWILNLIAVVGSTFPQPGYYECNQGNLLNYGSSKYFPYLPGSVAPEVTVSVLPPMRGGRAKVCCASNQPTNTNFGLVFIVEGLPIPTYYWSGVLFNANPFATLNDEIILPHGPVQLRIFNQTSVAQVAAIFITYLD